VHYCWDHLCAELYVIITCEGTNRRKRRLIEGKAICRHLKKLTCKGTMRQVFEAQSPIPSTPTPPYTLEPVQYFIYTSKRERGIELKQEKTTGATVHKAGSKIQQTDCISSL
jgi:hypothetical protein